MRSPSERDNVDSQDAWTSSGMQQARRTRQRKIVNTLPVVGVDPFTSEKHETFGAGLQPLDYWRKRSTRRRFER